MDREQVVTFTHVHTRFLLFAVAQTDIVIAIRLIMRLMGLKALAVSA